MKKVLSLTMVFVMLLGLCACGNATPKQTEAPAPVMEMGFARIKITPEDSVPLLGYGTSTKRMSTEVLDDLFVTCIAFRDEKQTALLFSQDLYHSTAVLTPSLRSEVSTAAQVPQSNIFIAATGTYSAPDTKSDHENAKVFIEKYKDAMIQVARDAVADLAPTTMSYGTTEVEGLNFIHHYTMEDGTVEDGNYGFFDRKITGHAAEADKTMRLVKAERQDKPAILLVNWQVRPTLNATKETTVISADFIGHLRNKVEADTGMHCVYFTGAFLDISPTSLIESEDHGLDAKGYGEKVAEYAVNALGSLKPLEGSATIGTYKADFGSTYNHTEEDKIDLAKQVTSQRKKLGDQEADKLAKSLGFRSVYHAAAITSRPARKDKDSYELSALRFGEMGFLMSPCAMGSAIGEKVFEKSPTEFSFLLCQANASWSALPSAESFEYGGYEADTSVWAPGVGERVGNLLNEMLLMTIED